MQSFAYHVILDLSKEFNSYSNLKTETVFSVIYAIEAMQSVDSVRSNFLPGESLNPREL